MLFANVGIPLIGPAIALGWLSIVPVVLVEAIIARALLRWPIGYAVKWVSLANGVTMLLGIPVVWLLTVIVMVVTGSSGWGDGSIVGVLRGPAWLGPGYIEHIPWAIPFALIVLCVPCFLMSWWGEYAFLRSVAPQRVGDSKGSLWSYAWKANFASYSLLVILLLFAVAGSM